MRLPEQLPPFAHFSTVVMESIILEVAGPVVIGAAAFGVSSLLPISKIGRGLSYNLNTLYFCAIPVLVYVAFRVYFLFLFRLTSIGNFSLSRPVAGNFEAGTCSSGTPIYSRVLLSHTSSSTTSLIARAAMLAGILFGAYSVIKIVPSAQESFQLLYDQVWLCERKSEYFCIFEQIPPPYLRSMHLSRRNCCTSYKSSFEEQFVVLNHQSEGSMRLDQSALHFPDCRLFLPCFCVYILVII